MEELLTFTQMYSGIFRQPKCNQTLFQKSWDKPMPLKEAHRGNVISTCNINTTLYLNL
jgi:hypothetical protein